MFHKIKVTDNVPWLDLFLYEVLLNVALLFPYPSLTQTQTHPNRFLGGSRATR